MTAAKRFLILRSFKEGQSKHRGGLWPMKWPLTPGKLLTPETKFLTLKDEALGMKTETSKNSKVKYSI